MCIFSNLFEILEILGATHTASVWPFQSRVLLGSFPILSYCPESFLALESE